MKKIIIAGGSGYLGRHLAEHWQGKYEIVTLVRKNINPVEKNGSKEKIVLWNGETLGPWQTELEGAYAVLNLAGRSVNCRYNKKNRHEMMMSRINSTKIIGDALRLTKNKPQIWLNSSTATIYAHSMHREMSEEGEIGKGLSVEIAKNWEKTLFEFDDLKIRQVALRSAMVFGPGKDGVFETMADLARIGLGGAIAGGAQYLSWIHLDDFIGMIEWIIEHEALSGPINLSSPHPLPQKEFSRALCKKVNAPFSFPIPEWTIEIGAVFKRTETELLLKSRRVVPTKILKSGYKMKGNAPI